ncbi:MAG TPA: hypothetical protein PLP33_25240 [Leptospiraceae bacterium]|nr:hypothetical protein [Leptospiraceae bacterium]
MNYYCARQRENKKWDFTRNGVATGYCRPFKEWAEEDAAKFGVGLDHPQIVKATEFRHKHHTDGHETKEQAQQCFREYVLDQEVRFNHKDSGSMSKCRICGEFTQLYVTSDTVLITLCEKHHNQESLETVYPTPSEIWSSW